jgi:hypothetical protein
MQKKITTFRRAFTLMELTVSIAILVVIILSVGVTFNGASKSVSVSNATMEMMSNVRAIQGMIEQDVSHIDTNGYIAIRACINRPGSPLLSERFDQISFVSTGNFSNRTGANTGNPFTDSSTAGAAHIWYGQGVLEGSKLGYMPADQAAPISVNQAPTGANSGNFPSNDMTLMRHQALLMPGPAVNNHIYPAGNELVAHTGLENMTGNVVPPGSNVEGKAAHITSSRYSIVAQTPVQLYQSILSNRVPAIPLPEAQLYTYRFRALASVYDTEVPVNPFVNGYFRTTPVLMQGVTSFKIEWTDGFVYPDGHPLEGELKWYGPTFPHGGVGAVQVGNQPVELEQVAPSPIATNLNDHYVVVFNYANRDRWPKALRFTMHIASDRLVGGRDFVQVVNLPQ